MANYEEIIQAEWDKYQQVNLDNYPNILILGKTGSGKSSLINTVFNLDIAKVSDVSPQTQEFTFYNGVQYRKNVNLIDSKGYELEDSVDRYVNTAKEYIETMQKNNDMIHITWFTLSVAGTRIEPMDIAILQKILEIPSIKGRIGVILTKCDEDDENGSVAQEFKSILKKEFPVINVFEVSNDPNLKDVLDLEKLVMWSADIIDDDDVRSCFISSQRSSLELIRKSVQDYVKKYAIGAGAVGATPIPFADATILVTLQLTMVVQITNKYGMQNLESIASGFISNYVISQLGKTLVANLLKAIPVVGTWVGGAINATVASGITYAVGMVISEICYTACKDTLEGKEVDFEKLFENDIVKQGFKTFYDEFIGGNRHD